VKRKEPVSFIPNSKKFVLAFSILIFVAAGVSAQSSPGSDSRPVAASSAAAVVAVEAATVQQRMERARALAAAHQLNAAATELESIRASVKDDVVRNNSSLMLMGIYLEDGNYARAESLLEETFSARSSKNEISVRTYFALAGQAVNGARAHLGRYRSFGINVSSPGLPTEAVSDLDRLRSLLERMSAQGKELVKENGKANDAFALLEEISGIRGSLARDSEDRSKWEREYSAARAKLQTLPPEIASIGVMPSMPETVIESPTRNAHPSAALSAADTNTTSQPATSDGAANAPAQPGTENNSTTPIAEPKKTGNGASPVEVGSLKEKATKEVVPVYPQMARSAGVSGLVRVKIIVDESGSVASIVWTEGPTLLRQATQDALRQWKFAPVVVDGKPVRATGYVDFAFSRN
jgi:TonB family protein